MAAADPPAAGMGSGGLREWLGGLRAAAYAPAFAAAELLTVEDCVLNIESEEDLVGPLRVARLKPRRDVWLELSRLRRLGGRPPAADPQDLRLPLLVWLQRMGLERYHERVVAEASCPTHRHHHHHHNNNTPTHTHTHTHTHHRHRHHHRHH